MQKKIEKLELVKDMIQQAIDKGATSVEQIHQYVADLPFEGLERAGLLDENAGKLREKKSRTIGMVYDAIRRINQQIGTMISDQFENLEDGHHVAKVLSEKAQTARPKAKKRAKKKAG